MSTSIRPVHGPSEHGVDLRGHRQLSIEHNNVDISYRISIYCTGACWSVAPDAPFKVQFKMDTSFCSKGCLPQTAKHNSTTEEQHSAETISRSEAPKNQRPQPCPRNLQLPEEKQKACNQPSHSIEPSPAPVNPKLREQPQRIQGKGSRVFAPRRNHFLDDACVTAPRLVVAFPAVPLPSHTATHRCHGSAFSGLPTPVITGAENSSSPLHGKRLGASINVHVCVRASVSAA